MQYTAITVQEYLDALPEDRKEPMERLRKTLLENLPEGLEETIEYGMINYVIPLSTYPAGYHVTEGPLGFMAIASQKNYISLYQMAIYSNPEIEKWFVDEYKKRVKTKLDMGKSCIRFKNPKNIPYDLIAELCRKVTIEEFIAEYEKALSKK